MSKKRIYLEKDIRSGVSISLKELPHPAAGPDLFAIDADMVDGGRYNRSSLVLVRGTAIELGRLLIKAFPDELDPARKDNRPGTRGSHRYER